MKKVLVAVRSRRNVATIASLKMLGNMFLIALIGIVITADYAHAQTLKKQIVGTWSVVSVVNEVDGKKIELYGPNPQGQFIFTADGHFSVNIMRPGRPKFASNNRTAGSADENMAAMAGYISTFGIYAITPDDTLTQHMIGSSFPNWDGAEQKRQMQIKGDEMTYGNVASSTGSGSTTIMLKRSK